jgi:hypothetical protein
MTPLKRLLTGSSSLSDFSHVPRDPGTIGAWLLSTVGVTVAATATVAIVVGYIATTLVTAWLTSALSPKLRSSDFGIRGTLVNSREAVAPQEYVYGTLRKGGSVTYIEATGANNQFLHMIICLAGHEVSSIGDIYINDEVVTLDANGFVTSQNWNSRIRIKKYTGSQTAAPADLLAESSQIDATFIGRGIAYLYVRLEYDPDTFPNGIPLFTAIVNGKKVYDPRTGTTAFSSNAALCIRDYITSNYGLADSSVNDTAFSASANVCDENVTLSGGGTEKRYTMNGVVGAEQTPGEVLQQMMTSCAGTLFWGQGKWQLKVGYYTAPVKTLTLNDLRGPISLQTRQSMADIFNVVRGTFNDKAQDYVTVDYPQVDSSVFLAEDSNVSTPIDLTLHFTTSVASAQRIAKLSLYRGREQMTLSADFGMAAFNVQVGDIVAFTNSRYGWTAKEFEVIGWTFFADSDAGDLRVKLTLRETSAAAFDWAAEETAIIANNSNLPSAWDVAAVGISVTSQTRVIFEKLTNVIIANVTAAASAIGFIERVEVQFKLHSDTLWNSVGIGSPGLFEILDAGDGLYDIRARAYNHLGVRGSWELYENYQVAGLAVPPQDVTTFHGQVYGGTIALEWTPVPDLDLSHYKIRYALEESGATYANATTSVEKVPRPGTNIVVPARPGTYMIRAVDKTGNSSTNYSSVVIPEAAFETYANTLTLTNSPTFAGTKTNCTVVSGQLRITSGTSATYEMTAAIDTTAARRVRARLDVNTNRYDPTLGTFDTLSGNFDALAGLFDDFTGGTNIADTDVLLYIAVSQDAVTYAPWQLFKGGDFYGRAFKFKIDLKSDTSGVTPSISGLTARVWYN